MLMPCCGCWLSPIGSILIPSLSFMLTPAKYLVCLMEQLVTRIKVQIHKLEVKQPRIIPESNKYLFDLDPVLFLSALLSVDDRAILGPYTISVAPQ